MRKSECLLETSEAATDCTQEIKMDVLEVCSISYSADVFLPLLPTRDFIIIFLFSQTLSSTSGN